jgi:hypothetical protein
MCYKTQTHSSKKYQRKTENQVRKTTKSIRKRFFGIFALFSSLAGWNLSNSFTFN